MAAPPALPEFEVIARSHSDLSRELGCCGNLPTLQEGNLILQELREMREGMREMREGMREVREEMREVREEMREMREEMKQTKNLVMTSNENGIARVHNSQISKPDQPLMPLRSVLSNEPIPSFPNTASDLQRLQNATVTEILRALDSSTEGNAMTRKLRLRIQCGLKEEPV